MSNNKYEHDIMSGDGAGRRDLHVFLLRKDKAVTSSNDIIKGRKAVRSPENENNKLMHKL